MRIRARTPVSGEPVAIWDVELVDNSQDPAAAVTADIKTPRIVPVIGIWMVCDVAAVTERTIDRFQAMLARKMRHHFVLDKLFRFPLPLPLRDLHSKPLPGALRVQLDRGASREANRLGNQPQDNFCRNICTSVCGVANFSGKRRISGKIAEQNRRIRARPNAPRSPQDARGGVSRHF
jgi:hypothetical protein